MRKSFGLAVGAALALTALAGCDENSGTERNAKTEKPTPTVVARLGAGWHAVADTRLSVWGFAPRTASLQGRMVASRSDANGAPDDPNPIDALTGIRAALMSNMLPARSGVQIEKLVNRALPASEPSAAPNPSMRPGIVLTTAPWNEDTMLLWIEVPGLAASETTAISVEFDPKAVLAFRTLGDPSALPAPVNRAAMIYELAPQIEDRTVKTGAPKVHLQYGVLHIGPRPAFGIPKMDHPVTGADAVGAIDNAPDTVRLATAAAGFGELLRGDPAVRDLSCNDVIALAQSVQRPDPDGWRARLIALMYRAQPLIDLPPNDSGK